MEIKLYCQVFISTEVCSENGLTYNMYWKTLYMYYTIRFDTR